MAKSKRQSTPKPDSANTGDFPKIDEQAEIVKAEIAASLAKLQKRFPLLSREEMQKRAEEQRKWAAAIDRYTAIRDNQIPAPWMKKPQAKEGPQTARIKAVLKELYPPDGRPPDTVPIKTIWGRVDAAFDKCGWKRASRPTIGRAAGRWGKQA
jgi:hypothetical protein